MKMLEVIYKGHRASVGVCTPIGVQRKSEMTGSLTFVKGSPISLKEEDALKLVSLDANFEVVGQKKEEAKPVKKEPKVEVIKEEPKAAEKPVVKKAKVEAEKEPVEQEEDEDFLRKIGAL